jgi:hypothetical protein
MPFVSFFDTNHTNGITGKFFHSEGAGGAEGGGVPVSLCQNCVNIPPHINNTVYFYGGVFNYIKEGRQTIS